VNAVSDTSANRASERTNQAKELYAKLIAPLERYLNPRLQLCLVPMDNLSFLPFAILVSPTSSKYLIEDYAIETSPSATIFINNSEHSGLRAQTTSEKALVVGNPQFDQVQFSDLRYLPAAAGEAKEVASLYGGNPLIGDAATVPRVTDELQSANVAHFATHAVPDEQAPLRSKLLLSKEAGAGQSHHSSSGFIQASEIYGMKLPRMRLVVLSACQTGIERAYRGEGAIGLARPFIAAGVPLVVATLWAVDSEKAANLMISFHKHRKQDHVSTVEALHRAQLEALHSSQSNSPANYDWAAFIAIGGYASF
jgi:CHAT domain-containing protein